MARFDFKAEIQMREEIKMWLEQAQADLKTATDCLKDGNYYATALFSQQSAEKSIKAYFIFKKKKLPPRTHNLIQLCEELNITAIRHQAELLTPAYTISRYHNITGMTPARYYSKERATELLKNAEEVIRWIEGKLKF